MIDPVNHDAVSGSRFSEEEMAFIIQRAAELQEDGDSAPEISLTEIQEIAAEAGIAPAYVAAAAAELRRPRQTFGILGAPTRFHCQRTVAVEVPAHALGELVECVREHTGLQGEVAQLLGTVEWRGRSPLGAILVTLAARDGATRIAATIARSDHAFVTAVASLLFGGVGALGGLMLATLLSTSALLGSAIIAVCFLAGTLISARVLWRNAAEQWRLRTRALVDSVADCAGRSSARGEVQPQT